MAWTPPVAAAATDRTDRPRLQIELVPETCWTLL
jgi:hypothetical protein